MSIQHKITSPEHSQRLTDAAAALGYEIVDIAGFLDLVEEHAKSQSKCLTILKSRAQEMTQANDDVREAVQTMATNTDETAKDVQTSVSMVRAAGEKTRNVAGWVQELSSRTTSVRDTLRAVKENNQQIAKIANQVNTLAINAKIEAARAGDAGRGFAVVAEAINALSHLTRDAAVEISTNIVDLTDWISELGNEAKDIALEASEVLESAGGTDTALSRMETSVTSANTQAKRIAEQAERVEVAMSSFKPALNGIDVAVSSTSTGIQTTHERVLNLIDTSETIVQHTALLNDNSLDAPFIRHVRALAKRISQTFDEAIDENMISHSDLFDRSYRGIHGSNPEQFTTRALEFLDRVLPPIQEPAIALDPKIVFCAAVDENGYLPTHNKKFSHPPSEDPVWNMGNCRNRRIFDDRVGLKAGRNREPFLLQVYRRDMGGGEFKMMKDLSAPILVKGKKWGGLRLAYTF